MSKRGATQQLSKDGNFFGDGSNELSGDDKPRQATAAQLAKRKLKPLKGRPRVAGSAQDTAPFEFTSESSSAGPPEQFQAQTANQFAVPSGPSDFGFSGPQADASGLQDFDPSGFLDPQVQTQFQAPFEVASEAPSVYPSGFPASEAQEQTLNLFTSDSAIPDSFDEFSSMDVDLTNNIDQQTSSQSFPPAAQQQPGSNAFGGFAPAPPSGGFNFSAGPASNPFASQNATNNNNNAGGSAFSSSFTFGSNPSGASNPFGSIASAPPANNAFGNAESAGAPSSNIFGSSSSAPSGNIFGGNTAPSAPSSNVFGSSSTQQNAFASKPSDPSSNVFANNSSGSTNMFGANPPASSGSIFGSTSSAAPASNIFASAASSAPSNNLFGASTSTAAPSNIFGTTASSAPSANIFASSTSAKTSDGTSQPQTGTIFGSTTTSGPTNAFGGTATSSAPSNTLFGSTASSAPSANLFGNDASSAPSKNAFGGATSSAPSNIFSSTPASSAPSSNLFSGSTASSAPSNNIFGKGATSSAPTTNLFGASTSNTSSAPTNAFSPSNAAPANNLFAGSTTPSGSSESASQTANMFAKSAAGSTPQSNPFNFGGANTTSEQSSTTPSGAQKDSASNIFSQSSGFQPSTSGAGVFNFSAKSPFKPTTDAAPPTDSDKDASATAESQAASATNMFAQSTSAAPKVGSNLFGSTGQSPAKPSTNLFNFANQSASGNADAQKDTQKSTDSQPSSTSNLFARAASGGASASATLGSLGQTASPKQDQPVDKTSSSNPFSSITPSTSSLTGSAAPIMRANGASSGEENSSTKVGSPAKSSAASAQPAETTSTTPANASFDTSKMNLKNIETARSIRTLNAWFKSRVSMAPEDGSYAHIAEVYLTNYTKLTSAISDIATGAQALTKSNGKRKADDESDGNGPVGAGSPKKSKVPSSQDDSSAAGASNTANVFNSIVNKPAQSPLRNVESATSPDAEAGPSSNNNLFAASASSPFKFGTSGGASGSTTPIGSPAKPSLFSQSPIKAPTFGQVGTTPDSKRKSDDISSDEQEEESQDETAQKDKRQKTSTPVSSADTGSVLNSRQASPDARNPFGHLSQEESNKDGDDDDASDGDAEQGSTTPTAPPKRSDGLFGRITKDDTASESDPKTSEEGGLFGRITGASTDNSKSTAANPFGFSASSYELPGGAKTGPVLKTWNGDAGSPIKFGTSQPAPSDDGKKEATSSSASSNPFSGIATGSSSAPSAIFKFTPAPTPPASDASPFKFNPPAATPSGASSVFASGFGSRATTPGVSTGASENETSAAENDEDEEAQTVDKEQVSLRTALTDEDRTTYDVLFDTDMQSVTLMHLVDRSEDEIKEDPKKGAKKWESQGKGPVRVLKHKQSGGVSILFKAEPMGRVLINTRVQPSFHYKRAKAKFATFPLPDEKGKITPQYLKFEDDTDCTKFVEACESNKSS
ncbi:Nucleoporin NUP152 [Lasiodiplodia hormozganensis]|uniref:Nucleoporin NUP152 n=1 Tax=Lasiodiplodia hormozganensis TaxID=869390 RepID=A0AA39XTS4_9PEZI|nr:Nucleoporin NUP152 [Lasiodiplodia hormozganensis]